MAYRGFISYRTLTNYMQHKCLINLLLECNHEANEHCALCDAITRPGSFKSTSIIRH